MRPRENDLRVWTHEELVASAASEGLAASHRLIREWVTVGLLDKARVPGRGPRRGVDLGTWSENQRQLFLALLRHRQLRGVTRNAPLLNIPVWLWATQGDQYVPTRQARRALATWAGSARRPPLGHANATAQRVVQRLAHPDAAARAKRAFREVLARGQAGEQVAPELLAARAAPVLDPGRSGRPRGPSGAQLSAQTYVMYVEAVVRGVDTVLADRGGDLVPDRLLHMVRDRYRASRAEYETLWREFARDPELGHLHIRPDLDAVVNEACKDVLVLLGFELETRAWRAKRPGRRPPKSGAPVPR